MAWTLSSSLDDFRERAGGFLAAHPAENTVLLTVVHRLAGAGLRVYGERPPAFGWWTACRGGPVGGAFVQTPPYEPRLGRMPADAAAELAAELASAGPEFAEFAGVSGGVGAVRAFAAAWTATTGCRQSVRDRHRLYRLGEPTGPPRPPAGRHRQATAADRELVIRWYQEFAAEAGVLAPDVPRSVDDRTAEGGLHLWEDGGEPVALAGNSPVVAGMSRIGPVYTPVDRRGRGYASAVTAAATAHALAAGAAEVLLYTDLANPVSNSIYQQIGYRPVEDCLAVDFTA